MKNSINFAIDFESNLDSTQEKKFSKIEKRSIADVAQLARAADL